jgi:hypothetical protein
MAEKPAKEKISLYLTTAQMKQLRALMRRTGLGVSELVRRAVDEYFERKER